MLVESNIKATSFKRSSDDSEVTYNADLHSVAKSGDYNDLNNKPNTTLESHSNDFHTEEYETVSGAQSKADTAESNANDYTDLTKEELQNKLDETKLELNKLKVDYQYQKEILMEFYIQNDVESNLNIDEPGYWYSPLGSTDDSMLTENVMDNRIKGLSDHHIPQYNNFDSEYWNKMN